MPRVDKDKATALYRLYDADEALLYVGIAVDPPVRLRIHSGEKTWWPQVARHTVEWHPDRPSAEVAEVAAIVTEKPRYNVEHSTTRARGDALAEYRSKYPKPRQIRIAVQMWNDFGKATKAAGTSRAAVIGEFMRWYMRRPGAKLPDRPPAGPWSTPSSDG